MGLFPKRSSGRRFLFHRLSVSPAAALTLAGVLTLASVIGRLAAALTFAGVLAFTSVPVFWIFRFLGLFRLLTRVLARGVQTSLGAGQQILRLNGITTRQQTRERCTNDQPLPSLSHNSSL